MDNTFKQMLREAGLRVTKPRLAVLKELSMHPHENAEAVRTGVTAILGSVSTQAIYDVLHTLTDKHILRMIEPAGTIPLYEICQHDNHHHLVCRTCLTVIDIKCIIGKAPCLTPSDDHGFTIDEAEVTFWGTCPDCRSLS